MKRQFPRLKIQRHIIILMVTALILAIVCFFFITFIHFTITLSTQPLPYIIAITIGAVVALPGLANRTSSKASAILLGIFCMVTIGHHFVFPDYRRPFVGLYHSIHHDMPIGEVQAQLDRHYPANGRHLKPVLTQSKPDRFVIFLDPNNHRWDEIIIIVKAGKVVGTAYIDD